MKEKSKKKKNFEKKKNLQNENFFEKILKMKKEMKKGKMKKSTFFF